MNNNKTPIQLPKLKEVQIQKDYHMTPMKIDYKQELKGLYGSKINQYNRMIKSISDNAQDLQKIVKSHTSSKLQIDTGIDNVHQDKGSSQQERDDINPHISFDNSKHHRKNHSVNVSLLAPARPSPKNLNKSESEMKLNLKHDQNNSSMDKQSNKLTMIQSKSDSAFQHVRDQIDRFDNMNRRRKLVKDPIGRYSSNSTPTKLQPILESFVSSSIKNQDTTIGVDELQDNTRKNNTSFDYNTWKTRYPKIISHLKNEIIATLPLNTSPSSSQQNSQFDAQTIKRPYKPYSPFFRSLDPEIYNKTFAKLYSRGRNNSDMEALQKIQKKDPEVISKVNLEKIYELQLNLLSLAESTNDNKRIEELAIKHLILIDKLDYFDPENKLLEDEDKIKLKTYFLVERINLWSIVMLLQSEKKTLSTFDLFQSVTSMLYLNFLTFIDFIMARFVTSYKQHQWHYKFRSLRDKRGEKTESLGSYNEKLIRAFRVQIIQLARMELSRHFDLLLEKLKQTTFETIYMSFKGLIANEIKTLKINVELPEEKSLYSTITTKKKKDLPPIITNEENPKSGFHLPPLKTEGDSNQNMIYTLVLDLDETLIHYDPGSGKGKFFVRPYAELFLKEMSQYYEIVIFTAAVKDYADSVLNIIDKQNCIKYRLYRNHTVFLAETKTILKDLSKLGRDLNRTIIIDNSPDNFKLQQDNGIEIKSWYSDPQDCALLELMPFLKDIVQNKVQDVRVPVRKLRERK